MPLRNREGQTKDEAEPEYLPLIRICDSESPREMGVTAILSSAYSVGNLMNRILFILIIFSAYLYADTTSLNLIEVNQKELNLSPNRITLTPKDWEGQGRNLADLLADFSGVQTQKTGSWGAFQSVSIHGMGGSRLMVLLDGFPLNASNGTLVDLGELNLNDYSKIELIKGNSWESNSSLGGVLLLTSRKKYKFSSLLQGGTESYYKSLIAYGIGQTWHLEANTLFEGAENNFTFLDKQVAPYTPRLHKERQMENADYSKAQAEISLSRNWHESTFEFKNKYSTGNQGLAGREGLWNPNARITNKSWDTQLDYRGGWNSLCGMHGLRFFNRWDSLFWTSKDPSFSGISTADNHYKQKYSLLQERSQISWQHGIWYLNTAALFNYEELTPQSFVAQGFPSLPADRKQLRLNFEPKVEISPSLFAKILTQHQAWKDWAEQDFSTQSKWINDLSGDLSYHSNLFSANFQMGQSTRLPSLSERFGSGVGTIGNPKILPEESFFYLASTGITTQSWTMQISYFNRNVNDAILPFYATGQMKYLNIAGAKIEGIELSQSLRFKYSKFAINGTYQETENQSKRRSENGKWLPGESPWKWNFNWQIPIQNWQLSWAVQYQSSQFRDQTNLLRVPEHIEHNLWLKWKSPYLTLTGECTNLLNSYNEPLFLPLPKPGRRFALTLQYPS